jgi:hypothetical protein
MSSIKASSRIKTVVYKSKRHLTQIDLILLSAQFIINIDINDIINHLLIPSYSFVVLELFFLIKMNCPIYG